MATAFRIASVAFGAACFSMSACAQQIRPDVDRSVRRSATVAASACRTDLDTLTAWLRRDYAGRTAGRERLDPEFEARTDSVRRVIEHEAHTPTCTRALEQYVASIDARDPDLHLWQIGKDDRWSGPALGAHDAGDGRRVVVRTLPSGVRRVALPIQAASSESQHPA